MAIDFIDMIREIIILNIHDEKFGVNELAAKMNLSRGHILRKVKARCGKTTNQLIKEIRLEEAEKIIIAEDITIAEIAYRAGFSSPSYFNKCFYAHFGLSPGQYKKQIEETQKNQTENKSNQPEILRKRKLFPILFPLGILLAILVLFRIMEKPFFKQSNSNKASIAVLPFLDLSENKNKEYVTIGMTDAVILELSKNKKFRVVSRGSAMMFKDRNGFYRDIAEQLQVNLLLEGSVLFSSDSMYVAVQLIEPFPREKHIWAKKYKQKFTDILSIIEEVSKAISVDISNEIIFLNDHDKESAKIK